jgi:uncharacterized Tic20 family protein
MSQANRLDFGVAMDGEQAYSSGNPEGITMPDNIPPQTPPPVTPPPAQPPESQARSWNMWCHMSALSGLIIPFGNVLGPLIVWQIKKNEFPSVEVHGKAALNFQITLLIALVALGIIGFVLSFFCIGFLFFFLIPPVALAGLIFSIIAGLKANEGKDYKYPYSLNLVK